MHPFMHAFNHSFIQVCINNFVFSFFHSLIHSFNHLLVYSFIQYYVTTPQSSINVTSITHSNVECSSQGTVNSEAYAKDQCVVPNAGDVGIKFDGKSSIEFEGGLNIKCVYFLF